MNDMTDVQAAQNAARKASLEIRKLDKRLHRQVGQAIADYKMIEGGDKVKYFEGTPIPTSVVLVGVLALAAWLGRLGDDLLGGVWHLGPADLHPLSIHVCLSGSAMISKTLRIPKF